MKRLVLLGDVLELRQRPLGEALGAAEPALRAIAGALPADGEVVVVPGNHDHHLAAAWLERRALLDGAPPLELESEVRWGPGDALAQLVDRLAPARVRVAYPGVWVREDVYATHGHYSDVHTTVPFLERLGAGAMGLVVGSRRSGPRAVEDYEAVLSPLYAWIHAVAQRSQRRGNATAHSPSTQAWQLLGAGGARSWRHPWLPLGFCLAVALLGRTPLGPLSADLSGAELARAGLRAMEEVLVRLRVQARYVVFGHSHRAGPLPGDALAQWTAAGGTLLVNAGCWIHEAAHLGRSPSTSPYRAGFAVRVPTHGAPELVNLLDGAAAPGRV